MLALVGLRPEHYDRYPHMFSGGQRQRIAIARALILRWLWLTSLFGTGRFHPGPGIEPARPTCSAAWGWPTCSISHDLGVVRHIAHDVLVMYLGHTVEHGEKNVIFTRPLHPLHTGPARLPTPGLAGSGPARQRTVLKGELPSPLNPPVGCVFSMRCPYATGPVPSRERPQLEELHGRKVACFEAERLSAPSTKGQ